MCFPRSLQSSSEPAPWHISGSLCAFNSTLLLYEHQLQYGCNYSRRPRNYKVSIPWTFEQPSGGLRLWAEDRESEEYEECWSVASFGCCLVRRLIWGYSRVWGELPKSKASREEQSGRTFRRRGDTIEGDDSEYDSEYWGWGSEQCSACATASWSFGPW